MEIKKMILGTMAATVLMSTVVHANDEEIDPLKQKIDQIDKTTKDLEKKKEVVKKNIVSTEQKLIESTERIRQTEGKITRTQTEIKGTSVKIVTKEKDITGKEKEIKEKEEILGKGMRVLYQQGTSSMIEVFFSDYGIREAYYKVDYMRKVNKYYQGLKEKVRVMRDKLIQEKDELEKLKVQQEQKKVELESLRETQESQQKEHEILLVQMEKEHKHLEEEISKNADAAAEIEAQISSIIQQREAARKKREAEERRLIENGKPLPPRTDLVGVGLSNPMTSNSYYVTSEFGWRSDPFTNEQTLHGGIDMGAPVGTPIYASDAGTVLYSGAARGFGNWIVIDHNNGYYTVYGHMFADQLYVGVGEQVAKGQHIAGTGNSGGSTGSHLHFEIHDGFGNKLNPRGFVNF